MSKKIVVYTCITGGYDVICSANKYNAAVTYICFNDGNIIVPKPWLDIRLKLILDRKDSNRHVKILPHLYPELSGYDLMIYIDGAISIVGDILDFSAKIFDMSGDFFVYEHPNRRCAYAESIACLESRKVSLPLVKYAIKTLRQRGIPEESGLFECGIIARKNVKNLIEFSNIWWFCYNSIIKRDQIALILAVWESKFIIGSLGRPDHRFGHHYFNCQPCHQGDHINRYIKWYIWRPVIKVLQHLRLLGL